jgi:hypothetical protein
MTSEQNLDVSQNIESNKITFAEKASARLKRAQAIKPALMISYDETLKGGKLTDKDVNALAETLSYVDDDDLVKNVLDENKYSPSALYAWAIANASIAFPYMSLKEASEKVTTNLEISREWGVLSDGKLRLPRPNEDREAWYMLNALAIKIHGTSYVEMEKDPVDLPSLANDTVAKDSTINVVLRRIVELMKSPLSATIRTGDLKGEDIIKNAVDFIVLDHIYRSSSNWTNLRVSDAAVRGGRRAISTEIKEGKGTKQKVTYTSVYVGYKLSEIIGKYVNKRISKSPESDTFTHLIISMIIKVLPTSLPEKYEMPKHFFESPSITVRKCLRQGPKITSKKGLKDNLYAPFSFVKSSECNNMPIDTRKTATDLSSEIIASLDQINKLDASEASTQVDAFKKYLDLSYLISDVCRDKWRKNLSVPQYHEIKVLLNGCVKHDEQNQLIKPIEILSDKIEISKIHVQNLTWIRVPKNQAEEDIIKNDIHSASTKRTRISPQASS